MQRAQDRLASDLHQRRRGFKGNLSARQRQSRLQKTWKHLVEKSDQVRLYSAPQLDPLQDPQLNDRLILPLSISSKPQCDPTAQYLFSSISLAPCFQQSSAVAVSREIDFVPSDDRTSISEPHRGVHA